jgi:hypothetical protein
MGGKDATRTPEQGVDTISYLINDIPFARNEQLNGKLIY